MLSGLVTIEKSNIEKETTSGSVAQSVEQRPFKALVPGSSPGRPTFWIRRGLCESLIAALP